MREVGRGLRREVLVVIKMLRWAQVSLRSRDGRYSVSTYVVVLDQCSSRYL